MADPTKPKLIRSHTFAELRALGPPEWIIDGTIPETGVGVIWGVSTVGKSFTLLSMFLSSVAGVDWCGFKTKRCRGLYVGLEGSLRDWGRRQQAWATLHGVTDEPDVKFVSAGFNIMNKDSRDELYGDHLEGRQVGLIGIDTLGQAMSGFDPNAPKDMIQLVGGGLDLSQRSGATVIFVHHPTKAGDTFSGAYAQLGNAGFNIEVALIADLPGNEKIIKLINHKQQEGEKFAPFSLRLVPVLLETPFGPTSTLAVKGRELVVDLDADEPPATKTAIDDALVAAFKVLNAGGEWPRGKIAEMIRATPGTGGVGNTVLNLALDQGVERRFFEREKVGREVVYWRVGKRGAKVSEGAAGDAFGSDPSFHPSASAPLKGGAEGRKGFEDSGKDAEASGKGTTNNSNQENSVEKDEQRPPVDDRYRAMQEYEAEMAAERQRRALGPDRPDLVGQAMEHLKGKRKP